MMKKQYITNEHYIPQFILRNFTLNKLLAVADISVLPINYFTTTPERIFFQKDLYEIKNEDGTYFDRNAIENRFAEIEGWIALQLRDLLVEGDKNRLLSGSHDVMLALLLSIQLARLPEVKQIVYGNNNIGEIEKNYIYQSFINSQKNAIEYLNQNKVNIPHELLKNNQDKTLIETVVSYLLSSCFFYIIDASKIEEKFMMADQPVLIWPFADAQYIFPVSPDFAVACCPFSSAHGHQAEGVIEIGSETVHKINEFSYKQCKRFIISKVFTESHRKILEDNDDK